MKICFHRQNHLAELNLKLLSKITSLLPYNAFEWIGSFRRSCWSAHAFIAWRWYSRFICTSSYSPCYDSVSTSVSTQDSFAPAHTAPAINIRYFRPEPRTWNNSRRAIRTTGNSFWRIRPLTMHGGIHVRLHKPGVPRTLNEALRLPDGPNLKMEHSFPYWNEVCGTIRNIQMGSETKQCSYPSLVINQKDILRYALHRTS